jgi:hypothetical protein
VLKLTKESYHHKILKFYILLYFFLEQFPTYIDHIVGRDGSVGIATRYGLDGTGIE